MDKAIILIGILFFAISATVASLVETHHGALGAGKVISSVKDAQATDSAELKQPKKSIEIPQVSGRQVKVPILMYHYIGNNPDPKDIARDNLSVSPKNFDEQLGYLDKAGYTPITLDTMIAGLNGNISLPPKPIVITFDDGYVDLYYNAFPILKKYNFHSVAFIPTGLIGTKYYASWSQLQEMQSSGLFSFEAHTINHANLPSLSKDQIYDEITQSKRSLQEKFGVPVNFMAYPYGTSDDRVVETVKKAGYIGALGTWFSTIQSEGTIFNMPRIKVSGQADINFFASRL